MATIDDLLARVTDTKIRQDIRAAVDEITDPQGFGIVFEHHVPETVLLPGFKVRKGTLVTRRDELTGVEWVVKTISSGIASLESVDNGERCSVSTNILIPIKPFGEPVYPALLPLGHLVTDTTKPWHAVINGENYHALQVLLYLYEGKVDCIYIDPPYNTGAKDWTYNNRFVDLNDRYRHSKWLSFMEKRLRLAKRLLKPDGVLVVTVDEHEVHHLGMLLEKKKLFSEFTRQMVTIVNNPKGVTQAGFSRVEEYAFFCLPWGARVEGRGDDLLTPDTTDEDISDNEDVKRPRWKGLLRSGAEARRQDREEMFYPVFIDEARGAVVGAGEPLPIDKKPDLNAKINGHRSAWPIRRDGSLGRWGIGHRLARDLASKGYISAGNYDPVRKTWAISYLSKHLREQLAAGVLEIISFNKERNVADVAYTELAARRIKTVWHRSRHDAGSGGSDLLSAFLGERAFPYPKSLYAVQVSRVVLWPSTKGNAAECYAFAVTLPCRTRPGDNTIADHLSGGSRGTVERLVGTPGSSRGD
jgi:adenine-specific DNA-methyltransferase